MSDKETATLPHPANRREPIPEPAKLFVAKPLFVELVEKSPMVLDMGEASREEGFRLNGCR